MPRASTLRRAPEWDGRTRRMIVVSAAAHLLLFAALVSLGPLVASAPQPMIAYTVELTDGASLGGRIPAGAPGKGVSGGPTAKAPPAEPPSPPPGEAKPPAPEAKPSEPPAPPPEPPPAPKAEP